MKLMTMMAAVAATFVFSYSAQAREHHFRHPLADRQVQQSTWGLFASAPQSSVRRSDWTQPAYSAQTAYRGESGRRPAAWCGWQMRQLVSSDPGAEYNLARNWSRWGHAGPAGVGAVVVWSHHVGKIVGQQDGQWLIESGNDGHALRTRTRSIAGAIAIRWG